MIDIREMSVLIADDMENMFNSIRSIMRLLKFGRKFTYACNGEEALKILKEGHTDLAMLDNNMPGMTGLELLQLIRQERSLRDIPVVMVTAHAEKEFITNAAESEIDAYILKPITVGLLKEKIPEVIAKANKPSTMYIHLKNACRCEEEGDLDAAIRETQLAMEANPKSSRPLREIGYYYFKQGDLGEAEQYLLKAAKMNPIDVIAFNHLGDLYLKQDKIDSALKYFSKAIEISPRHYERALNLGKILIKKKMTDKAVPVFNKVFELSREPLVIKEEIADLCLAEGATDYAAKLLKEVISFRQDRADLLFKLGVIYAETGKHEEAVINLSAAERLDSKNIDIKVQLARLYLSQGMIIRAEKPLNAVLAIDPEHKEAKKLLRQCI